MSPFSQQLVILLSGIAIIAVLLPRLVPLNLLRLTPLITSTINLMWAADEYMFLSSWLSTSYREQAQKLLPLWFATWGPMGSKVLFSSFPFSLGAVIGNILTSRDTIAASGALKWYWAGLIFTMVHFVFAPKALRLLAAINKAAPAGSPTESLRHWIAMHLIRVVTADATAFLAYATAVRTTMQVVA
jgi:hypothetical protein